MTNTTAKHGLLHPIECPAIESQLEEVIAALWARMEIAGINRAGVNTPGRNWPGWGAKTLSRTLAGRGNAYMGPTDASRIILNGLLNPSVIRAPSFWATPLGRALAFWGTGEPSAVTRSCAAAALGMTRQNVLLMLRDGRLSEPVDAGTDDLVSTASLAHAMRVKYPMGG